MVDVSDVKTLFSNDVAYMYTLVDAKFLLQIPAQTVLAKEAVGA